MWLLLFVCMCYHSTSSGTNEIQQTTARQYNQMSYTPVNSALAQFNSYSKLRCIAQCARLTTTCNIALFNAVTSPRCILYSESFTAANLVSSSNYVVIDFKRNLTSAGKTTVFACTNLATERTSEVSLKRSGAKLFTLFLSQIRMHDDGDGNNVSMYWSLRLLRELSCLSLVQSP